MLGTVRRAYNDRGFWFADGDDGKTYFIHHTALQMPGYKTLEAGQRLEFDIEKAEKGPRGVNVRVVPAEADTASSDGDAANDYWNTP